MRSLEKTQPAEAPISKRGYYVGDDGHLKSRDALHERLINFMMTAEKWQLDLLGDFCVAFVKAPDWKRKQVEKRLKGYVTESEGEVANG